MIRILVIGKLRMGPHWTNWYKQKQNNALGNSRHEWQLSVDIIKAYLTDIHAILVDVA